MLARLPRRPLVFFAAALAAQLLLLAFQVRDRNHLRLIRVWTAAAFTPLESASTASIGAVGRLWSGYIGLRDAQRQNRQLRAEVDQLQLKVDRLNGQAAEAARLATLLGFRDAHPAWSLLAARVVAANPAPGAKVVYIDRGARDGVRRNMGVITPDGVVGKILEVYGDGAQVLLVTDRESGVGALLAPTRTEGVVEGAGGSLLSMNYVADDEKISPGESVLTSGLDQIFPPDLPVGAVIGSRPGSPFRHIELRPAAHLDRLEDVLVILTRPKPLPQAAAPPDPPGTRVPHAKAKGGL